MKPWIPRFLPRQDELTVGLSCLGGVMRVAWYLGIRPNTLWRWRAGVCQWPCDKAAVVLGMMISRREGLDQAIRHMEAIVAKGPRVHHRRRRAVEAIVQETALVAAQRAKRARRRAATSPAEVDPAAE